MQLRPYQLECLESIESKAKEGLNRQMVVLPTGAGKTVIFSELIRRRSLKTLVIAHRIELLEQAKEKLLRVAPDIDVGIHQTYNYEKWVQRHMVQLVHGEEGA